MHHASKRPLIQGRTIRVPIDHTVPDLPACRRRGGFQVGGIARKKRFDIGSRHLGSKRRADQANDASRNNDGMCSNTHDSCVSMKKDFVTARDRAFIRKDNPICTVAGRQHPEQFDQLAQAWVLCAQNLERLFDTPERMGNKKGERGGPN